MFKLRKAIGIMAATNEGVIGKGNALPWNYPEELEHFRSTTHGHTIIMGRKTYEALPEGIFSSRKAIIFSKNPKELDAKPGIFVKSLEEYFDVIDSLGEAKKIFMIGGAEIAHLFLKHQLISSFILTRIHRSYSGDTYLDLKYFKGWRETVLKSNSNYTILQLTNM
jgi:dihydrofolate reductase